MKISFNKIWVLPITLLSYSTLSHNLTEVDNLSFYVKKAWHAEAIDDTAAQSNELGGEFNVDSNMPEVLIEKDPFKNMSIRI